MYYRDVDRYWRLVEKRIPHMTVIYCQDNLNCRRTQEVIHDVHTQIHTSILWKILQLQKHNLKNKHTN